MKQKTKTVEVHGQKFQIGRFTPEVGSFILAKLIGALGSALSKSEGQSSDASQSDTKERSAEEKVKMLVMTTINQGNLDFDSHCMIQLKSMAVCARLETTNDVELPMPIVTSSGVWALPEMRDDLTLIMRLETEVLVFNLSDFFAAGGLNEIAGNTAPTA